MINQTIHTELAKLSEAKSIDERLTLMENIIKMFPGGIQFRSITETPVSSLAPGGVFSVEVDTTSWMTEGMELSLAPQSENWAGIKICVTEIISPTILEAKVVGFSRNIPPGTVIYPGAIITVFAFGADFVFGNVAATPADVFVQTASGWSPQSTSVSLTVEFIRSGNVIASRTVSVSRNATTGTFAMAPGTPTDSNGVRVDVQRSGSINATVLFTHLETGVIASKTLVSVFRGADGSMGANPDFIQFAWLRSTTEPSPPSGGTYANPAPDIASGWSTTVPSGVLPLWMSSRRYRWSGDHSSWSPPSSASGDKGGQGDQGPGLVYRGPYDNSKQYYFTGVRRDVVHHSGHYWISNSLDMSGFSGWGIPGVSDQWQSFGENFESVATKLLLAEDAVITKSLTIGQDGTDIGLIQSANFEPSKSGFRLNANGDAEFNAITLRRGILGPDDILMSDPSVLLYDATFSLEDGDRTPHYGYTDKENDSTPPSVERYGTFNLSRSPTLGWDTWAWAVSDEAGIQNTQWVERGDFGPDYQVVVDGQLVDGASPGIRIAPFSSSHRWAFIRISNRLKIPCMPGERFVARVIYKGEGLRILVTFYDATGNNWLGILKPFNSDQVSEVQSPLTTSEEWDTLEHVFEVPDNARYLKYEINRAREMDSHQSMGGDHYIHVGGALLQRIVSGQSGMPTPAIPTSTQFSESESPLVIPMPTVPDGAVLRFTTDGTEVNESSAIWHPDLSVQFDNTGILRARFYAQGTRIGGSEAMSVYTMVPNAVSVSSRALMPPLVKIWVRNRKFGHRVVTIQSIERREGDTTHMRRNWDNVVLSSNSAVWQMDEHIPRLSGVATSVTVWVTDSSGNKSNEIITGRPNKSGWNLIGGG